MPLTSRRRRAGPDARRVGPPPPPGSGPAEDARLHPAAAGRRGGLAGDGYRGHRGHPRGTTRDRARPPALDSVRPQHQRGARSSMPVLSVLLVAIGALVFANLHAALPRPGCGTHTGCPGATGRVTRSWTLQEPQIESPEHQDNSDVYYQPRPEVMPEEQDIHADHDGYQREHVKRDGCRSSHRFVLLCAAERSKNSVCIPRARPHHAARALIRSGLSRRRIKRVTGRLRRLRTAASRSGRHSGRRGDLRVSRCIRGLRCR
jgi:hypothetical protein